MCDAVEFLWLANEIGLIGIVTVISRGAGQHAETHTQ